MTEVTSFRLQRSRLHPGGCFRTVGFRLGPDPRVASDRCGRNRSSRSGIRLRVSNT